MSVRGYTKTFNIGLGL